MTKQAKAQTHSPAARFTPEDPARITSKLGEAWREIKDTAECKGYEAKFWRDVENVAKIKTAQASEALKTSTGNTLGDITKIIEDVEHGGNVRNNPSQKQEPQTGLQRGIMDEQLQKLHRHLNGRPDKIEAAIKFFESGDFLRPEYAVISPELMVERMEKEREQGRKKVANWRANQKAKLAM